MNVLNTEPAPFGLPSDVQSDFGYSLFSARYGNIYTTSQLKQLCEEALHLSDQRNIIWEKNGRFFDALRPGIEPEGFDTAEQLIQSRTYHLKCVKELLNRTDLFIFTLGLTECWEHTSSNSILPIAPGVIAGQFEKENYRFVNLSFSQCLNDFIDFRDHMKSKCNPNAKFLLTVSPVPLTATYSGSHVLHANTYSKATLRAVAAELYRFDDVDYFPSYEIVTNPANRSTFFENNLRSVTSEAVAAVMKIFFDEHQKGKAQINTRNTQTEGFTEEEFNFLQCEEVLLEADQ